MSYIYVIIQIVFIILIGITGPIIPNNIIILIGEVAGVLLMVWAIWTMRLGNLNISPDLKKNSILVLSGPYKLLRHPMYTAVLLVTLMLVINDMTLWRIGFWLVLIIDLYFKFLYEEKLLLAKFPQYSDYMSKTKRLIPFIY
jgi:protein-S-isoprenylcysteine O-methyltransferase Ste14